MNLHWNTGYVESKYEELRRSLQEVKESAYQTRTICGPFVAAICGFVEILNHFLTHSEIISPWCHSRNSGPVGYT